MTDPGINDDFSRLAVVHTADVEWQASPSPSVWRKRLDLTGPSETSRVTSVVRYDADSVFPSHPHPDGEEILVLDGVFSDEHGDYRRAPYLVATHVLAQWRRCPVPLAAQRRGSLPRFAWPHLGRTS